MFSRKLFEIVGDNFQRQPVLSRGRVAFKLQPEALLQIACPHTCRVEVLDDLQYGLQFCLRNIHVLLKEQIV